MNNEEMDMSINITEIMEKNNNYIGTIIPINYLVDFSLESLTFNGSQFKGLRVIDYKGRKLIGDRDIYQYELLPVEEDISLYLNFDYNSREKFLTLSTDFSTKLKIKSLLIYPPNNSIKLLAIGGPSGSGKNYLEDFLAEQYPLYYNKLPQVTTRERRDESDSYLFTTKEFYADLSDRLIGRIYAKDNKYGNYYGTLPLLESKKINTIIVSEEGYSDLMETYLPNYPSVTLLSLYVPLREGVEVREGREDILESESKLQALFNYNGFKNISRDTEGNHAIARLMFQKLITHGDKGMYI